MPAQRTFAMIRSLDQWRRAVHDGTTLDADGGGIMLRWEAPALSGDDAGPPPEPAGLAFDSGCRLYHAVPEEDRTDRYARVVTDLRVRQDPPAPVPYLPRPGDATARQPQALAVDAADRLFVVEAATGTMAVYDLWNDRLVRRVQPVLPSGDPAAPRDVAMHDFTAWVLTGAGLFSMTARSGPAHVAVDADDLPFGAARRVAAAPDGLLAVLVTGGGESGRVVFPDSAVPRLAAERATDLTFLDDERLVLARAPGDDFRSFRFIDGIFVEDLPLQARGYDGRGIVTTPDGQVGYWTNDGLRVAVAARVRYQRAGFATTFRLDSGEYHQRWGRVFLDACVPEGTSVRLSFVTTNDDDPDEPADPPSTPLADDLSADDLTPPQLPALLTPIDEFPVHRRETGREVPWKRLPAGDPFETYEAPVHGEPGRFLWVRLHLEGNNRVTPQVRALRAEHQGHDLLRRLPRIYSRDEPVAAFLQRYLAMFDGVLTELEGRAVLRHVLLDPQATPEELLPWLSTFVGLVQDERWAPEARRTLLAEAAGLFARRGTMASLSRLLQIYLGLPAEQVIILEHFRLRGLGGSLLGDEIGGTSVNSVLGAGLRVGGQLGTPGDRFFSETPDEAFDRHAHRFSVLVPVAMTSEQRDVVNHILEVHRPAHTVVEVCGLDRGLRVGKGLHVGLSAIVGRSSGFFPYQLGDSLLGRDAVVGRPDPVGEVCP